MLLMLPLGKVFDRVLEDWWGSVWYSFSQRSLGDEWSTGSGPTLAWEEWWLEPMRPRVSLVSMGLQMLLVGEGKLCRATEPSFSLGGSTITASGSSCGRDCLAFIRLKAAWRKRKNLLLPKKWEKMMRRVQHWKTKHSQVMFYIMNDDIQYCIRRFILRKTYEGNWKLK